MLYVRRAVAMVLLLMQLECEWIALDGMSVVCESCSRHGVIIDAASM